MTPIEYHFIAPDGEPIANTDVEFILLAPAFDPQEPGILLPRVVVVTTNALGKGVVNLVSVDVQYQVVIYDLRSDAALSYKFYVPDPTPGLTFRLQDLIVAGPISETTYDEAAILAIQNAKVNAMAAAAAAEASKVAAMGYATTASNSVGAVIAAKDAAILSKDAAAVSASEAVTNKNIAVAKALEATNKATEALGHATFAETKADSATASAASATGSASTATTKATEAAASKDAAVAASTIAIAAQGTATSKAAEAAAAVVAAAASANVAATKEAQALAAANSANSSFNGATDAANLATLKASAAALSATGAANSAETATTKANEAAANATLTSAKASEAAASAVLATSRIDEAAASAILAQNSATLAGTKATESSGSATASAASAALSLTREQVAKKWAEEELGIAVEPGKFSAKHWANQAQASATGAMVYRGTFSAAAGAYPANPKLGDYYKISVGGTLPLIGSVAPTDSIIYNGTGWDKIDSTDAVTSVAGRIGSVILSKADVGLSLVDNTADIDKPISTLVQDAINTKANLSNPSFTGDVLINNEPVPQTPKPFKVLSSSINCISDIEYRMINSAAITAQLPANPEVDDIVSFVSDNGRTDNVITRNGSLINGLAEDIVFDVPTGTLRYIGSSRGWIPAEDRIRSSGVIKDSRDIALLFANGEQGAWYDPSDLTTLFQDAAGTVPVTAVEQPVGLMLDKSGRGNHATQATTTKRPIYSRRVNELVNTANQNAWSFQGSRFVAGPTDGTGASELTASIQSSVLAGVNTDYPIGTSYSSPACIVRSIEVKAGTATHFTFGSANSLAILRLSDGVFEHRQNLATATATPSDDGYWRLEIIDESTTWNASKLSNYICWGKGRSGSVINTTDQIGSTVYVRRPSFVVNGFGFRGSVPYQRVNTATDYDADPNKFPAYLRFDGVDDAMQTGNIDFTGTDKMTVWAGVTKLSDAAAGAVLELSSNYTNPGAFLLSAPIVAGNNFGLGLAGSYATASGYLSPRSSVLTGSLDIAGSARSDEINLRIDSLTPAVGWAGNANAGTGNFQNSPLYIGARAGTSQFFNGRIYQLIVRGAQSSLSQIEVTEAYIKQKMRLP